MNFLRVLLVLACVTGSLLGQTASIAGRVTDSSGSPIPDAQVLIVRKATNQRFETKTSGEGFFVLYHCTAGKDRTGMATAFLLTMLGVKKDVIEADYLLINKLMPPDQTAPAMAKRLEAMVGAPLNPELVKLLLGTRIEWLRAAFEGIEKKSGSFDAYRREVLGLSDEDVAVLKLRLLE